MEQRERDDQKQRMEMLKNYQIQQAEARRQMAEKEYKDDIQEAMKSLALLDEHDKGFYSYAEKAIREWSDQGKNIKPLIMELKSYNKRKEQIGV